MSNFPSLYATLSRQLELLQEIEANDGELTPALQERFTLVGRNVETRAQEMLDLREALLSFIEGGKAKVAQAQAFIAQQQRVVDQIDASLKTGVQLLGPFQLDTHTVSLRASVGVVIDDMDQLSDEYLRKKETFMPDKIAIRAALDEGKVVRGARLESRQNLSIR